MTRTISKPLIAVGVALALASGTFGYIKATQATEPAFTAGELAYFKERRDHLMKLSELEIKGYYLQRSIMPTEIKLTETSPAPDVFEFKGYVIWSDRDSTRTRKDTCDGHYDGDAKNVIWRC